MDVIPIIPVEFNDLAEVRKYLQDYYDWTRDGTVWADYVVDLTTAKVPAANAPTFSQVADDGAASTGVFAYHFADGEYLFFVAQMPHGWKEGSTIYTHIHFECTSDVDPADNFGVGLEYLWVDINEDRAANTTVAERDVSTGVDSNTKHQVANLPAAGIDGTGHTISSLLVCRLYRLAAGSDNYADDVIIYDVDIHYEINTSGSRQIFVK